MGLGIWEACVAGAGFTEGFEVTAGVETGARYLIMAGSTSGVPLKNKHNPMECEHHGVNMYIS